MRTELAALLALFAFGDGIAAQDATPGPDDPRPQGHLSMRERSLCEPPETRPDWCEWPHEVRAFVSRRDECDHWRGEARPEGDTPAARDRRHELRAQLRATCTGTDLRLSELLVRYRDDPAIAPLLATFERTVESAP